MVGQGRNFKGWTARLSEVSGVSSRLSEIRGLKLRKFVWNSLVTEVTSFIRSFFFLSNADRKGGCRGPGRETEGRESGRKPQLP